jgi:hypothetical protein
MGSPGLFHGTNKDPCVLLQEVRSEFECGYLFRLIMVGAGKLGQ